MKSILVAPIVSEKAVGQAEATNTYHFKIQTDANKIEVKRAIEKKFDVKVKDVRVINVLGKAKRQHTRTGVINGKKADWKKAIVRLNDGYKLDLYSTAE
jgi:large subunit ribosomal protein L23